MYYNHDEYVTDETGKGQTQNVVTHRSLENLCLEVETLNKKTRCLLSDGSARNLYVYFQSTFGNGVHTFDGTPLFKAGFTCEKDAVLKWVRTYTIKNTTDTYEKTVTLEKDLATNFTLKFECIGNDGNPIIDKNTNKQKISNIYNGVISNFVMLSDCKFGYTKSDNNNGYMTFNELLDKINGTNLKDALDLHYETLMTPFQINITQDNYTSAEPKKVNLMDLDDTGVTFKKSATFTTYLTVDTLDTSFLCKDAANQDDKVYCKFSELYKSFIAVLNYVNETYKKTHNQKNIPGLSLLVDSDSKRKKTTGRTFMLLAENDESQETPNEDQTNKNDEITSIDQFDGDTVFTELIDNWDELYEADYELLQLIISVYDCCIENHELAYSLTNSLLAESMEGHMHSTPFLDSTLAGFGYCIYNINDGNDFGINCELVESKNILNLEISIPDLTYYNHFLVYIFDTIENYDEFNLDGIKHIFEIIYKSKDEIELRSNTTFEFTAELTEYSDTNILALYIDCNALLSTELPEDIDYFDLTDIYYKIPPNPIYKEYIKSLGTSSNESIIDQELKDKVIELETSINQLKTTFEEVINDNNERQNRDVTETYSLEPQDTTGEVIPKTFEQVLNEWKRIEDELNDKLWENDKIFENSFNQIELEIQDCALKTDLNGLVTENMLENYVEHSALEPLATKEELNSYVKQEELNNVVTTDKLEEYVKQEQLTNLATKEELNNVATKELEDYVKLEQLESLATKEELNSYVTQEELTNVVTTDKLEEYVKQEQLESLATKEELNSYVKQEQLEPLATKEELNNYVKQEQLTNLATKEDLNNVVTTDPELSSKITKLEEDYNNCALKTDLNGLVTENILEGYVTIDRINTLATKEQLVPLATKEELEPLASKEELTNLATKEELNNYVKQEELEPLATKEELVPLATKEELNNYVKQEELEPLATKEELVPLATKEELNNYVKQEQLNNVVTTDNLEDYVNAIETNGFTVENGFGSISLTYTDFIQEEVTYDQKECLRYHIKVDDEIFQNWKKITERKTIFKILLRKKYIVDITGKYISNLEIYAENNSVYCSVVIYNDEIRAFKVNDTICDTFAFIAFDIQFPGTFINLFNAGELSVIYQLPNKSLTSSQPTIKCDIIEARNALRLHESNIPYLYRPSYITEETLSMPLVTGGHQDMDFYKMVFEIPEGYDIPDNTVFKFQEYCFGNEWVVEYDGTIWRGFNCQGKFNSKAIGKCYTKAEAMCKTIPVDVKWNYGAWIMVKNTENNRKLLPEHSKGLAYSLWENARKKFTFLFKDGTEKEIDEYYNAVVEISEVSHPDYKPNYDGYDNLPLKLTLKKLTVSQCNNMQNIQDAIDKLYIDFFLEETNTGEFNKDSNHGIRVTFRIETGKVNTSIVSDESIVSIAGIIDTIEQLPFSWQSRYEHPDNSIYLYLRKDYVDPIDEVNWDSNTNAFEYIIRSQFYEVTPNPNAATTLYTDYNITSSKIITADNITTMRSDLNLVTNTVDVIDYDLKEVTTKVDTLNSEMVEARNILRHFQVQEDWEAFTSMMGWLFTGGKFLCGEIFPESPFSALADEPQTNDEDEEELKPALLVASDGITFYNIDGAGKITGIEGENYLVPWLKDNLPTENLTIESIINWCDSNNIPVEYSNESIDPQTRITTIRVALDLCNYFRNSLKPIIKQLATNVSTIDFSQCVQKTDLRRDDVIDITYKVDTENNNIIFEAEDIISNGYIVFIIYGNLNSNKVSTVKRIFIKILDGNIEEYRGVDTEFEIDGKIIKGIGSSQTLVDRYMPDITNDERTITIEVHNEYKVVGLTLEHNSFERHLEFSINDLAYTCDIEALHKKIDSLAKQSYSNDVAMFSAVRDEEEPQYYTKEESDNKYALKSEVINVDLSEYATIDQVNKVLTENYRQKDDLKVGENDSLVLKSEVSTAIELTEHITKETFKGNVPCEITTKHFVFEADFMDCDTVCVEFCEGTRLVGEIIDNRNNDWNFSFDIIYQTKRYWDAFEPEYKLHGMPLDVSDNYQLIWDELSGCMYCVHCNVKLTLAEKPDYVKPLLKTDIITTSDEAATDDKSSIR